MASVRKFAADDANLNTGAVIVARNRKYLDLDLDFSANPNTGDIFKKKDANAVKEAIKNLILTDYNERPYQPYLGSNVRSFLFELADEDAEEEILNNIKIAIQNYEPRAKVKYVTVTSKLDSNSIDVTIQFVVITTQENATLEFSLNRLR